MSRIYSFLIVFALMCTAIVSCGVPRDDGPSALNNVPDELAVGRLPTPTPLPDEALQKLYMVGPDNRLIGVFREAPGSPTELVQQLFLGTTPGEAQSRVSSAITRTSAVASVDTNPLFRQATVTLDVGSLDSAPEEQLLAFGQIVFSLTELEEIDSVGFQMQTNSATTQPMSAQTDLGISLPGEQVSRANYASIDPDGRLISFGDAAPTATPEVPQEIFELPIWVINESNELVPITRRIAEVDRAQALLQSLFDSDLSTQAVAQGLRSAIPLDAEATSFDIIDRQNPDGTIVRVAAVDLAGDRTLPPIELGDERLLAIAQIVYTLTGLAEIDQVLIQVGGRYVPLPTQLGLTAPLSTEVLQRSDFSNYAPSVRVVDQVEPTPDALQTPVPAEPAPAVTPEPTVTPDP